MKMRPKDASGWAYAFYAWVVEREDDYKQWWWAPTPIARWFRNRRLDREISHAMPGVNIGVFDGGPVKELPDNPLMREEMPPGFWTAERAAAFRDRGQQGTVDKLLLNPLDARMKESLVDLARSLDQLFSYFNKMGGKGHG